MSRKCAEVAVYNSEALVRYEGEEWLDAAIRQARKIAPKSERSAAIEGVQEWFWTGLEAGLDTALAAVSACWEYEVTVDPANFPGVPVVEPASPDAGFDEKASQALTNTLLTNCGVALAG